MLWIWFHQRHPKRQGPAPSSSSSIEKGLGSPVDVVPKKAKKRRFHETTKQWSPPKPMRTRFTEEDFRTPLRNRTQALNSPLEHPLNPSPDQNTTPDSPETMKKIVAGLKGLEIEENHPRSNLSQWLGQPKSPDMSVSVRAQRSSPPSLSGFRDFVGGPIHLDSTPNHSKFRRMQARSFNDLDDHTEEIDKKK